jgi:thymidylate synthase (FAD)
VGVRLVWATPNGEALIAEMARVSNPDNKNNTATAPKLIKYLIDNKHWSPFEMVNVCMEIVTTRDIARQILRHRSFSFQEFSQRYAIASSFTTSEARLQDDKNRQNSIETTDELTQDWWKQAQECMINDASVLYRLALNKGIAKEVARKVLPEGLTPTRMYMNGNLRSWLHYIELRSGVETQKEHREVAVACATVLESIFPMITEFLVK